MVVGAVVQVADSRKRPPATVADVLNELERTGLIESVAALRT